MDTRTPSGPLPALSPDVLTRVASGDQQALGTLYDESSAILFTLVYRILQDRDAAGHVLHDLYLDIARKAARYDPRRGSPIAWLILLARTRALERLRAKGGRKPPPIVDGVPTHLVGTMPEDQGQDRLLQQAVIQSLSELPPPQQKMLELAYYDGLLVSEIAVRLNEAVSTIRHRLKLALARLHDGVSSSSRTS